MRMEGSSKRYTRHLMPEGTDEQPSGHVIATLAIRKDFSFLDLNRLMTTHRPVDSRPLRTMSGVHASVLLCWNIFKSLDKRQAGIGHPEDSAQRPK